MSQPINDILLTSYALGELCGEELAGVEKQLETSAEARARVAELQSLAALLRDELGDQSAPGLDAERRARVEAAASGERPRGILLRMDARPWAAAAAILLAFGGALGFGLRGEPRSKPDRVHETAQVDVDEVGRYSEQDQAPVKKPRSDRRRGGEKKDQAGQGDETRALREVARRTTEEPQPAESSEKRPVGDLLAVTNGAAPSDREALKAAIDGKVRDQTVLHVTRLEQQVTADPALRSSVALAPGGGVKPGSGDLGPVGGGSPGGGPGHAPGSPAPDQSKSSGSAVAGGAGGNYKGPPATEAMGRRARKKSTDAERSLAGAEKRAPATTLAGNADLFAGSTFALDRANRLNDELTKLEKKADKLPASKRGEVQKFVREAKISRAEVALVESLEVKKQVAEVELKLERYRVYVEDELRRSGGEDYSAVVEQPFKMALTEPLSTIGLDVDTASYANVRRFLTKGQWPPRDAVRVDEMVNYFHYKDQAPEGEENLAIHAEVAACPWNLQNRLLRVAFKAKEIARDARGATSLVFLVDISGSMRSKDKLPLLKEGLKKLTEQLGEDDAVSIVTYASGVRVALEPTFGNDQNKILGVLDSLNAGGSTNGAGGIQTAYEVAQKAFVSGGTNRVILCTDGDFNVGVSDTDALSRMIEEKAKSKVFLSVLGFGTGNLKDGRMQALANKGNGHYAYIDSRREAEKVLVEELSGTLVTVAKDAKLQIEFNPAEVNSWRLLGYSARILQAQDFNDDKKDAGEIGAGHSVVALYELRTTNGGADQAPAVDPLKYQEKSAVANRGEPGELATVKLRYKMPEAEKSRLRTLPVVDDGRHYGAASVDFKLSASVALFGQLLSRSTYVGSTSLEAAQELALESIGPDNDPRGLRRELSELIKKAIGLRQARNPQAPQR